MSPNDPWKPPAFGSPMHINIPARDVQRSQAFYVAVFGPGWKWYNERQPSSINGDELVLLDWKPDVSLTAGIAKVEDAGPITITSGRNALTVWYLVEDVQRSAQLVVEEGGKMISEMLNEGANGLYAYFEDTEGVVSVLYQFVGTFAAAEG